jgi:hypothetical protein
MKRLTLLKIKAMKRLMLHRFIAVNTIQIHAEIAIIQGKTIQHICKGKDDDVFRFCYRKYRKKSFLKFFLFFIMYFSLPDSIPPRPLGEARVRKH